jgi:hypothetical protein
MADTMDCPRCRGQMDTGFVMDKGHYSMPERQVWVEGEPEKSIWTGFKTKNRANYVMRTYRCRKCGYLESYATEPKE